MCEKKKTVLLGMSGGVDSSVAALLLKKKGYNVIGAFLKIYSDTKNKLTGQCAYLDELKMARKISSILNIPLIVLDYEKDYKKHVLNPMFKSYASSKTPNPDISCNAIIKFPFLWKAAKKYKADLIATGHYAKIKKYKKICTLLMGKDNTKDQSYFLAELAQKDLSHTIFPIGNYTKKQIRDIARRNNFPNWNKHGTVGICFVGQQNMQNFLKQKIKEKPGKVITPTGDIIGTHKGISFYTIGQKTGEHIGINVKKPREFAQKRFYVGEKRRNNLLVVAPEGHPALKRRKVLIKNLHLINAKSKIPAQLKARIRHLGFFHLGKLKKTTNGWSFTFNKPLEALAEGQYIVFYKGREVMGCGEMSLTYRK